MWLLLGLKLIIRIIARGGMVGTKLAWGGLGKMLEKIVNVVNVFNDMKKICYLNLNCYFINILLDL